MLQQLRKIDANGAPPAAVDAGAAGLVDTTNCGTAAGTPNAGTGAHAARDGSG